GRRQTAPGSSDGRSNSGRRRARGHRPRPPRRWSSRRPDRRASPSVLRRAAVERFDDRAFERGALLAALQQVGERLLHRLQLADLLIDLPGPPPGDGADAGAIAAAVVAQLQQLLDLVEAEAEALRALDEADHANRFVGKLAIARFAPRRLRDQPAPLVVAKGLYVDARLLGGRTGLHGCAAAGP